MFQIVYSDLHVGVCQVLFRWGSNLATPDVYQIELKDIDV